jgi:hypothetical protein
MNEQEILEAARKAIEAGESPDSVAQWIQEATGVSLVEMAERHAGFKGAGAGGSWEPSTDEMLAANTRRMGLDPNMPALEAGGMMADAGAMAMGGGAARQGLGAAVDAVRIARGNAVRMTPEMGGQVMRLPGASRMTAMQALRRLVKNPWVRGGIAAGVGSKFF